MQYYKTWQEALIDFVTKYGHNYTVPYNLIEEFEQILRQNVKGKYFLGDLK